MRKLLAESRPSVVALASPFVVRQLDVIGRIQRQQVAAHGVAQGAMQGSVDVIARSTPTAVCRVPSSLRLPSARPSLRKAA